MLVQIDEDVTNEIEEVGRIQSGKKLVETSSSHAAKKTKGPLDLVFTKA